MAAAVVYASKRFGSGKDLVQVADRTFVRVAGIGAADARRIGDHGAHLLPKLIGGIGQVDSVAVALGHLAAVEAGELGRGREEDLWFGQKLGLKNVLADLRFHAFLVAGGSGDLGRFSGGIQLVEPACNLAREFNVRDLILTYRDKIGLVEQDVCRLQERVSKKAMSVQLLLAQLLLLVLVGGHSFKPAERRDHAEQRVEL